MAYVYLIPSIQDYAHKFRKIDSIDFKIIKSASAGGFLSVGSLAESTGIPKQTVSYHLRKLQRDVVRFRVLLDESKLGLKSFVVTATTQLGQEKMSSRAMTCFPLWRYLAIVDGCKRGNYVRYCIPSGNERDFGAFLNEVKRRNLISEFEVFPTSNTNYPLLNLDFYVRKRGFPVFNWDKWVNDFDKLATETLVEPQSYDKFGVDIYDLIILRCLEIDARTNQRRIVKEIARILNEKKSKKFIPLVSRRMRQDILGNGLIRGYRVYLYPNPVSSTLFLMYHLTFANSPSLSKFVTALSYLPYNTSFEKVLGKNELFVRFILPAYEYPNLWKSLASLAEQGFLKEARLFFGDLANKTWDNVEIYQMFKNNNWNFSYGIAVEMLEKTLAAAR